MAENKVGTQPLPPSHASVLNFRQSLLGLEMARKPPVFDAQLGPELEKVASDWLIKYVPVDILEDAASKHPMAACGAEAKTRKESDE